VSPGRPGRRRIRRGPAASVVLGALVLAVVVPASVGSASTGAVVNGCSQTAPAAGCQGIVSGLAATPSQVTVHGHGQYAGLAVTVNQTQNLVHQAISLTWTGGSPTFSDPTGGSFTSTYNGNYLQIFECWGNPQTSDPAGAGAGPLPSQCEFGGESDNPTSSYPIQSPGFEYSRVLSEPGWDGYSQLENSPGVYLDKTTGFLVQPFDSVDGTVVGQQADYNYLFNPYKPQPFWLNPYFSFATTNEVDFSRTFASGTGQQLFQVDTGLEAPGLGCGQSIQPTAHGTTTPQCWLVVVPRSTPTAENPANVTNIASVQTSPLTPEAWANRIAIPLGFNPVGSSCSISANAQQIIGGELASPAVSAWQPSLCNLPGKTPFAYIQNNDDQARQNISDPSYGSVGMSVFSDPIAPAATNPKNPVVYAPLTLSGVVVSFNIERAPVTEPDGTLQPEELGLAGDRVAHLYLTPLLVARLLTESYKDQLQEVGLDTSKEYAWAQDNPQTVFNDPQFLQYNPEFSQLTSIYTIDAGALVVEEGSSDATRALWNWVLADPEARAWLDGSADSQMKVNPYYSTDPTINPSGKAFGDPGPEIFPKSDPYCVATGSTVYGPPQAPARPLCVLDWTPYQLNLAADAQATAAANDGAKTTFNPTQTPDLAWTANGPQITGNYFVMSVTDSASAARFGLQTASLSPAGDDSPDRPFVAPDQAGLLAGEKAMLPTAVKGVVQNNPSAQGGAYPLTMLSYAATTPDTLNAVSRRNYSAFLRYAAGAGQTVGLLPGDLPAGYVPLPAALDAETLAAASTVATPPTAGKATKKVVVTSTSSTPGPGSTTTTTTTPSATGFSSSPGSGSGPLLSLPDRVRPKIRTIGGTSALSAVRSLFFPIGFTRWILPLLLLIGAAAALGAYAANLGRRKRVLAEGLGESEFSDGPDPSEGGPADDAGPHGDAPPGDDPLPGAGGGGPW